MECEDNMNLNPMTIYSRADFVNIPVLAKWQM